MHISLPLSLSLSFSLLQIYTNISTDILGNYMCLPYLLYSTTRPNHLSTHLPFQLTYHVYQTYPKSLPAGQIDKQKHSNLRARSHRGGYRGGHPQKGLPASILRGPRAPGGAPEISGSPKIFATLRAP